MRIWSYHIDTSVLSSSRLRFSNDILTSSIRSSSSPTPLSGEELIVRWTCADTNYTIIFRTPFSTRVYVQVCKQ